MTLASGCDSLPTGERVPERGSESKPQAPSDLNPRSAACTKGQVSSLHWWCFLDKYNDSAFFAIGDFAYTRNHSLVFAMDVIGFLHKQRRTRCFLPFRLVTFCPWSLIVSHSPFLAIGFALCTKLWLSLFFSTGVVFVVIVSDNDCSLTLVLPLVTVLCHW